MADFTGKIICIDSPPACVITVANEDGSHHTRAMQVVGPAVGGKPATVAMTVTIDGKAGKREDLHAGMIVTLVGDPVTAATVTTKKEEPKPK